MLLAVPIPTLIENVRNLIVSHAGHDDAAFRRSAEALVRELSVGNRPGEAKALREALRATAANGTPNGTRSGLVNFAKRTEGLVSFISRPPHRRTLLSRGNAGRFRQDRRRIPRRKPIGRRGVASENAIALLGAAGLRKDGCGAAARGRAFSSVRRGPPRLSHYQLCRRNGCELAESADDGGPDSDGPAAR